MAYPTVRTRTETPITSASTTLTVNFNQQTGDLVIIFLGTNDTARTLSTVGDSFTNWTNTSANFHVLYKVLDGSEGGNMAVTVAASTKGAAIAYNITAGTFTPPSGGLAISTVATGATGSPDSSTLSPAPGSSEYLWISAFRQNGEEADDDTWVTSAPTTPGTFTNLVQVTSGTASTANTNGSVGSAEYTATTATVDPGAFTVAQSIPWRAYTVAVFPVRSGSFTASALVKATVSNTFTISAVISKTQTGNFTASAVFALLQTGNFTASAIVLKTTSLTFTASADVNKTISGSFTASALVAKTQTGSFAASALVAKTQDYTFTASAIIAKTQADSFTASAIITTTVSGSLTASAVVFATREWTLSVDAQVAGLVTAPTWVSPENNTAISNTPVLVFTMPNMARDLHFHIQLDKVDTFNGANLTEIKSHIDQSGWEFWDGDTWEPVPADGVPLAYAGNNARYTVSDPLSAGTWYRRVRAG